jgi:hypothetical protein
VAAPAADQRPFQQASAAVTDPRVHPAPARGLAEQIAEEAPTAAPVPVGTWRVGIVPSPVGPGRVRIVAVGARGVRAPARAHVRECSPVVVSLLGVQDLLQLTVVEEDSPAVLALLQVHPLLVDGTHRSVALRTYHGASIRAKVMPGSKPPVCSPQGGTGEQ